MNLGIGLGVTNYLRVPTVPLDPDAAIAALFESGEEGAWYDPSDLSTMYQDAVGTTPVTAAGQPVGLILDKSKGLTLGSELVTGDSSTFTTGFGDWVYYTGATATADGVFAIGSIGTYTLSGVLTVGKTYQVEFDWTRTNTSNVPYVGDRAGPGSQVRVAAGGSLSGRASGIFRCAFNQGAMGSFVGEVTIDNISIRELSGNHATQTTSAARPVLQTSGGLWYLDFDGADDWMRATFASTQAQPNTLAAAFKFDQGSRLEFLIDGIGSYRHTIYKTSTQLGLYAGSGIFDPSIAGTSEHVAVGHLNTTSSDLRVDGTSVITGNTSTIAWGGVTLGANASTPAALFVDGRIYSFVGINRTLTAGEITDLESYLGTKSGFVAPEITGVPTIAVS